MNEMRLNKARLNVVSLNKALINGAVERHGSSAGGGGAPSKYIRFADPAVEAVLMANGVSSDGVGITKEDAAAVTTIGKWFNGNTTITSFNELQYFTSVPQIGPSVSTDGGFLKAINLKSIVLPPSVKTIGVAAFQETAISSINLGNVTTIMVRSFQLCANLRIVNAPKLEDLGHSAFYNSGITEIVSLGKVTASKSTGSTTGTFRDCKSLTKANLTGFTIIGPYDFSNCSALAEVIIDWAKVTSIGSNAFNNCTSLAIDNLNLASLTSLGQNAFYGVKIKKLNLGKVTSLPSASSATRNYGDKSVLEEVIIPEGVTDILAHSFRDYKALKTAVIPNSTQVIRESAFTDDNALTGNYTLPHLQTLKAGAFRNTAITSFTAASLVEIIGEGGFGAFQGCTKLETVEFENVVSVGVQTFRGCSKLTNVIIPNAEDIAMQAFQECVSLKVAEFESKVKSLGDYVLYKCTGLEKILCRAITPPTLGGTHAFNNTNNCPIYVPDAALEVYKTATNWSTYADRIHPLSELEGSPYITFADPEVERVLMENNVSSDGVGITMADAEAVTSIGTWFRNNAAVTSFNELQYFTRVEELAQDGFHGSSITEITCPSSLVKINPYCFYNCTSLTTVNGIEGVTEFGESAFNNCSALVNIDLSKAVKTNSRTFYYAGLVGELRLTSMQEIGHDCFFATKATALYAPAVVSVGAYSFMNCYELGLVDLGDKVTYIGDAAFNDCRGLNAFICRASTPPTLYNTWSLNGTNNCPIYVPDASVDAYKAAANWSTYADRIKPMSEIGEAIIETGYELQADGSLKASANYCVVGHIMINGGESITWGIPQGIVGYLVEYAEDGSRLDYWRGNSNERTITTKSATKLIKACFPLSSMDDAFIRDNTNDKYLWKGKNVE